MTFESLNRQLAEWQSAQPLKREDWDRLWRKLRLDWNYHSNHIEGNTLTYGETEILLIHGQATGDHGLRNYVEMQAHDVAIEHLSAIAKENRPLSEADIRSFNQILLKESFWKEAITPEGLPTRIEIIPGQYKEQPNNVRTASGEIFRFADPSEVPILMSQLVSWLRDELESKKLHVIEIAAKLHYDFVRIHPFGDGNGRTARLLANYVLMRTGYLPLIVPTEQKDRYLAALRKADSGDLAAFTDYLATCLSASMERGLKAARGESIEEPDDLHKEIELFKRRQMGGTKNVIPQTAESMQDLYRTTIRPLCADFVETMAPLNDLFSTTNITINGKSTENLIWQDVLNDWFSSPKLPTRASFIFGYELRGFKGTAPQPFNIASNITFTFSDFYYIISVGGRSEGNRLYGQPLSESDRKAILRPALESLFKSIKQQSGEN